MLRRVIIPSRHYLECSAAILACELPTWRLTSVHLRWSTAAAANRQDGRVRYASLHEESPMEGKNTGRKISTHIAAYPSILPPSDSPEYLANTFTSFLQHHGQTTELALQCLNSGSPTFSSIHKILQSRQKTRRVAEHFAASSKPALCIRLLSLVVAYGHPPNAPMYEGICWTLSQHKQYALVLEVCLLARDNLGTPTSRLLGWWLKAACERESFASIDAILRECEDAGVKLSRRHWHLVLAVRLRNRNLSAARQCLKSMEDAGFPPDPNTHVVIAANYRYLGQDPQVRELALSVLNSLPRPKGTFTVNQLLKTHLQFEDELGFFQLLSVFDSNAIGPLRMLLCHLVSGQTSPMHLSASNSPNFVNPDANTFLICVQFCAARSDYSTAEKIFALMQQQGFGPSPSVLVAWLDLQFALERPGLAVHITSRLLAAHGLNNLFDQLINPEMEPPWLWPFTMTQVSPSVDIFNVLLRGLLNVQGLKAARVILELMKRTDIEPNSHTLNFLISYLLRSKMASAPSVLRILRQLTPLFRPSLHHIRPILNKLLQDERRRTYSPKYRTMQIQARSAQQNYQDDFSYDLSKPAAGLRLEQSLGRPNLGRSLLQSLESREVRSDPAMFGLRIRYEGIIRRDVSAAVDVYNSMLAAGMTPSRFHIAALMETFTRQGETDTAVRIMRSANVKPNVILYTILIHGYAHQGQPNAAAQLFQDMISNGIQPDVRAICALCNAFVLMRQRATARKFLLTLWGFVGQLPPNHDKLSLIRLLATFRSLDKSISKWNINSEKRDQLQQDLVRVVMEYKHAAGLSGSYISSSTSVRQLMKKSVHVSRKL